MFSPKNVIFLLIGFICFFAGYDRTIPWSSRLAMTGKELDGCFNLQIDNVKLSDSGEYQCQVTPAKNHPPLRAVATLNVLG